MRWRCILQGVLATSTWKDVKLVVAEQLASPEDSLQCEDYSCRHDEPQDLSYLLVRSTHLDRRSAGSAVVDPPVLPPKPPEASTEHRETLQQDILGKLQAGQGELQNDFGRHKAELLETDSKSQRALSELKRGLEGRHSDADDTLRKLMAAHSALEGELSNHKGENVAALRDADAKVQRAIAELKSSQEGRHADALRRLPQAAKHFERDLQQVLRIATSGPGNEATARDSANTSISSEMPEIAAGGDKRQPPPSVRDKRNKIVLMLIELSWLGALGIDRIYLGSLYYGLLKFGVGLATCCMALLILGRAYPVGFAVWGLVDIIVVATNALKHEASISTLGMYAEFGESELNVAYVLGILQVLCLILLSFTCYWFVKRHRAADGRESIVAKRSSAAHKASPKRRPSQPPRVRGETVSL